MRLLMAALTVSAGLLLSGTQRLAAADPVGSPATLRVFLPPDAKLTIDGHATTSSSGYRTFRTPPLQNGKAFEYTLRAEYVRGNKTFVVTSPAVVRAGEESTVSLLPAGEERVSAYLMPEYPMAGYWHGFGMYGRGVAPMSAQDSWNGAGPTGSNSPWALGTLGD